MAIEIVDLSIQNGDFPLCRRLPEGSPAIIQQSSEPSMALFFVMVQVVYLRRRKALHGQRGHDPCDLGHGGSGFAGAERYQKKFPRMDWREKLQENLQETTITI